MQSKSQKKPIVLIVDWRLSDDEFWLQGELERLGFRVVTEGIPDYDMKNRQIRWRKLILWMEYLMLGWCGARMARRVGGVVVAWNFVTGVCAIMASCLFRNRPPVVALNMIAHEKSKLHNLFRRLVYHWAFGTNRMLITANSSQLRDQYIESFRINPVSISVLHDPWSRDYEVRPPDALDSGYAFSGGDTARDWDALLAAAQICPEIPFKVVARRMAWRPKRQIPPNVSVVFDTSLDEFYTMARQSRIVLLPLNSNVTAGLIVLIRSLLLGRPVIATETPVLTPYFPDECGDLLVPMGGVEEMASTLRRYWTDHELRVKRAAALQSHVLEHFSPDAYARQVADVVGRVCTALDT